MEDWSESKKLMFTAIVSPLVVIAVAAVFSFLIGIDYRNLLGIPNDIQKGTKTSAMYKKMFPLWACPQGYENIENGLVQGLSAYCIKKD